MRKSQTVDLDAQVLAHLGPIVGPDLRQSPRNYVRVERRDHDSVRLRPRDLTILPRS